MRNSPASIGQHGRHSCDTSAKVTKLTKTLSFAQETGTLLSAKLGNFEIRQPRMKFFLRFLTEQRSESPHPGLKGLDSSSGGSKPLRAQRSKTQASFSKCSHRSTFMKKRLRSALLAGLVLAAAPYTMAATKYWSGTGTWNAGNTNWGTSPGGPYNTTFIAGDDAVFEGTAATVTVSSPNNPNSITFNVTGYTLSSGTVTFNADPCTITTGSGISATISSVLAGASRGLTKAGAGTLALSGANTYTGVTNVNAGIRASCKTLKLPRKALSC